MAIFKSAIEKHKADIIVLDMKLERLQRMAKKLEEQGVTSVPARTPRYSWPIRKYIERYGL